MQLSDAVPLLVGTLGFTGVVASLLANGYFDRKRLFAEQLAIAFDRFKESQRRSAGIASLAGLRQASPRFWAPHDRAVSDFIHAQAVYLLTHASNRWRAHEIMNLRALLLWLFPTERESSALFSWQAEALATAMRQYVAQGRAPDNVTDEERSPTAIDALCRDLERSFIPRADVLARPQESS